MTKYIAKTPDSRGYVNFTAEENATWKILFERQIKVVQNRGCQEYLDGLKILNFPCDRIPQCGEVSETLKSKTGWAVQPVDAIIPLEKFFLLLANRQFPAATFIRTREEIDYLQEPDIFHEFFGHCPLLTNQAYADFIQWYGETALRANKKAQTLLGRLFWFTIEFGLINTVDGLRIYGGGILSSYQETLYALESKIPERIEFNISKILATPYRYDEIQKHYFFVNQIADLFTIKSSSILEMVEKITNHPHGMDDDFVIC
jgi:phenylalanine-4-hydroxylase